MPSAASRSRCAASWTSKDCPASTRSAWAPAPPTRWPSWSSRPRTPRRRPAGAPHHRRRARPARRWLGEHRLVQPRHAGARRAGDHPAPRDPRRGRARGRRRDHRHLRQGQGRGDRDGVDRHARRRPASRCSTTRMSAFIRGEGGWGGDRGPSGSRRTRRPSAQPDHAVTVQTRTDQALLYRLSGDRNPLHSDPAFAALGGFDRPILHGLCTYGFTGRALLHALCGSDPARFTAWTPASLAGHARRGAHREGMGRRRRAPSSRPAVRTGGSSSTRGASTYSS